MYPIQDGSSDVVVVGAGAIGGWAAYFAAASGARVVVLESKVAGWGASSRAAGIVRAQGGRPETVRLGQWSIDFYKRQPAEIGTDSGFRELGYILLATTKADEREGRERVAMQRDLGLEARWVAPEQAVALCPTLSDQGHRGGSYVSTDGAIDPPRNVRAYCLALSRCGVDLRERTRFLGIRTRGARIVAVDTSTGPVATDRVILAGGPGLRELGELVDVPIPVGGARHQVAVTAPHPAFDVERMPMVFDVRAGLYWRLEEGGLLFGMSNPQESPGEARAIDWPYMRRMRRRLARLVPVSGDLGLRKVWAATIDYTPDHLPIIGPAISSRGEVLEGVTIATAGGHGMMWGPAVARAAADLALKGETDVVDCSALGLDRFDARGRSRIASDPIALPFPVSTGGREPDADVSGRNL